MQTRNKFLDDMSQLMTNAMGVAQGAKTEAETAMRSFVDRWMADRDFVTREEFDAARAMAQISATGLISATMFEQCGKHTSFTLPSESSGASAAGSRWPVCESIRHSRTSMPSSARRRQTPLFAS